MRINLGSRNNLLDGYMNIDLCDLTPAERSETPKKYIQANVMDIDTMFLAGTVDEVYSYHLFEHLTHAQITILMYKIWLVLKPGGRLHIVVPDFAGILTHFRTKQQSGDFSDADIIHIKVFDTVEETYHKTVWYEEIGKWYILRENFFEMFHINKPSEQEIEFIATKIT